METVPDRRVDQKHDGSSDLPKRLARLRISLPLILAHKGRIEIETLRHREGQSAFPTVPFTLYGIEGDRPTFLYVQKRRKAIACPGSLEAWPYVDV